MFVETIGRLQAAKQLREGASALAGAFDASELSGDEAVSMLRDLARTRRFVDTLLTFAAAHIEATDAHRGRGDRSPADTVSQALGTGMHEARTMLSAGRAAQRHPELERAARSGDVTPAQTSLIGATLEDAPGCADELLAAAQQGLQPLRDKCVEVRARHEDEQNRRRRQRRARSLNTWTDTDGMFCGRFRLEPHIGGQIKALLDESIQRRIRAERRTDTPDDRETREAHAADAFADLILGEVEVEFDIDDGLAEDRVDDDEQVNIASESGDIKVVCDVADVQPEPEDPAPGTTQFADPSVDDTGAVGATTGTDEDGDASGPRPNRATRRRNERVEHRRRRRRRPRTSSTVHVVIDLATLLRGEALPGERCEIPGVGPVNAAWVREILGESFLTAVIANGVEIRTVAHSQPWGAR
jgi:hypothetical protein